MQSFSAFFLDSPEAKIDLSGKAERSCFFTRSSIDGAQAWAPPGRSPEITAGSDHFISTGEFSGRIHYYRTGLFLRRMIVGTSDDSPPPKRPGRIFPRACLRTRNKTKHTEES